MILKQKIEIYGSTDSAEKHDVLNFNFGTEKSSEIKRGNQRYYNVPNNTSNEAVDLAGLTEARLLIVKTTKPVTIELNGSDEFKVVPPSGFNFGYAYITTGEVYSISISNTSGYAADVWIGLGGDLT